MSLLRLDALNKAFGNLVVTKTSTSPSTKASCTR